MSNKNGSGRLHRLLADYEEKVIILRGAIELLNGHALRSSKKRAGSTFETAVAMDAERRVTKKKGSSAADVRRRRQQTVEFLSKFDPKTPIPLPENSQKYGIATLIRHGYLKKRSDGFVRTAKAFSVEIPPH